MKLTIRTYKQIYRSNKIKRKVTKQFLTNKLTNRILRRIPLSPKLTYFKNYNKVLTF